MRDDGVLYICNLIDEATNGDMPYLVLDPVNKYWFKRRTIGYNRLYAAKGANEQIDLLVRIAYAPDVEIGQYAVLGNGDQYRIDNVQHLNEEFQTEYSTSEKDSLLHTDLTLSKVGDFYDVNFE